MSSWYRYVVLGVLVLLVGGGWVSLVRANVANGAAYEEHLAAARAAAQRGVTHEVLASYKAALELRPSNAVAWERAEYLKENGSAEQRDAALWEIASQYEDAEAYADLVESAVAREDYRTAFETIRAADSARVTGDRLTTVADSIAYVYELGSSGFEAITPFFDDIAAVDTGDGWRAVNSRGRGVGGTHTAVGSLAEGRIPVVGVDGTPFFMDAEGDPVLVATKVDYVSYGVIGDGIFPGRTAEGAVVYLDTSFVPVFGDQQYADGTAFQGGVAAVSDGQTWSVIDVEGKVVLGGLDAVIVDDRGTLGAGGRFFAVKDGATALYSTDGSRVSDETYLDARAFVAETAAVRKAEGWGFIDVDGAWAVSPRFDDARSSRFGLAPVKVGELWGFASSEGRLVIEPAFSDATAFASTGAALVRQAPGDKAVPRWVLLQLLRHEED